MPGAALSTMTVTKRSRFGSLWQFLRKLDQYQLRPGLTSDVRTILGPYVGSIRGMDVMEHGDAKSAGPVS
jgi:hypothetical protein